MERTKKNTKRKIVDTVMGVVLVCGIGILSYPFIRNSLNDLMNQQIIQHYQQQANQKSTEEYQQKLAEMEAKISNLLIKISLPDLLLSPKRPEKSKI